MTLKSKLFIDSSASNDVSKYIQHTPGSPESALERPIWNKAEQNADWNR
jgi:hypothetical protein